MSIVFSIMSFERFFEGQHDKFYFVLRILVGFMFFTHGAQKLFGWFGGQGSVELFSLLGLAGVIESVGGLLIFVGLFTRLAAFIAALEMVIAYFIVHIPISLVPLVNGGEPAVLFFAAFLLLMVHGGKIISLERYLFKKEYF